MRQINAESISRSRRSVIELGRHKITIERPTPWDVVMSQGAGVKADVVWASGFVVGWDLQEIDLVPGGLPLPVVFDGAAFGAWIKDYPDLWQPLVKGVIDAYQAYEQVLADRGNV